MTDGTITDRADGGIKARLSRWSRELWWGGHYIAAEGDRWFLKLIDELNRGAERTRAGFGAFGRRLIERPLQARRRMMIARRHERLRQLLFAEAERASLNESPEAVQRFAEQMATLLELVLSGRVAIGDVTFEEDRRASPDPDCTVVTDSRQTDDRPG